MTMANREFLLKGQPQKDNKYDLRGWYASEKLDGVRAFWDGGISRGLYKSQVPYANNKSKDDRLVLTPKATGLWSTYGNPIMGPDWFLDTLPKGITLDGELHAGRRLFQTTTSTVSKLVPVDSEWEKITFHVFDSPSYPAVFANGKINNPNFIKEMDLESCMRFVRSKAPDYRSKFLNLQETYEFLLRLKSGDNSDSWRVIEQTIVRTQEDIQMFMDNVLEADGEGVIFRDPKSYWEPKRSHKCIKLKPYHDGEGTVVGYVWGRETDKGSKLFGMMGALILDYNGKRLEIGTGFTDSERVMAVAPEAEAERIRLFDNELESHEHNEYVVRERAYGAGKQVFEKYWHNPMFPIGTKVTIRYRELSDDQLPKEARFDRIRFGHA